MRQLHFILMISLRKQMIARTLLKQWSPELAEAIQMYTDIINAQCSLDRRLISCCADGSRVAISIVWVLSTRERRDHAISNPDTSVIISPGTGARR